MRKNFKFLSISLALLTLFTFSCKKAKKDDNTNPGAGYDRKALLTHTADEIIIPSYSKFKVKIDSMTNRSNDFTANPTLTTLADLRQAWLEAYIEWQKIELFDFGPASNIAFRSYMNIYPTNVTNIDANIANASANLEVPAAFSSQGFPAFDYLLNGLGADDATILTYYTSATDAAARLAYITRLTTQMHDKTALVYSSWTTGGYRDEFISKSEMDMSSSVPLLVNGYILNYERSIRTGKFGLPSGAMVGGTPTPSIVEAVYKKDISLTLAQTAHNASIDYFNGKSVLTGSEGPSLKTYLTAINATDSNTGIALTDAINTQFGVVNSKLALLSENFNQEVQTNNQKMIDVYTELQNTVRLLKVDMTSALSITITYVDTDGD